MWEKVRLTWLAVKKRLQNKVIFVFLLGLAYKILQDIGIVILPEQWAYYTNAIIYLLAACGFFIDFTTPGIKDKTE